MPSRLLTRLVPVLALFAASSAAAKAKDPWLPGVVVVGVAASEKGDAAAAKKLGDLLADMAQWNGEFGQVVRPTDARARLGADYDAVFACSGDASCYGPLARKLDADRIVAASLASEGINYRLTIRLYDRGMRSTDSAEVESVTLNADEIAVLLPDPYNKLLERGSQKRAKIAVVCEAIKAQVALSGDPVGFAPVTKYVPAGSYAVRVEREGYATWEEDVILQPGDSKTVEAVLKKGAEAPPEAVAKAKPRPSSGSILAHPGLWTAVAGVAAIGVGVYFGLAAKVAEARGADPDRDGVRDITRAEALQARENAMRANVVVGAGAAAVAGGAIWIVVSPPAKAAPTRSSGDEPVAMAVGFGGTF